MARASAAALAAVLVLSAAEAADAQSLRGSRTAMQRQHLVAKQHDFTFIRTSEQVQRFARSGYLERFSGNANYELARVSYPYGRPALRLFVERLSAQYKAACGEKLVVTSLTRPVLEQPRNASDLSVHPAGMAVDLRVSRNRSCVRWLEQTLLSLEKQGVLDATRENRPPHYHIALFPEPYTRYVAAVAGREAVQLASATKPAPKPAEPARPAPTQVAAAKPAEPASPGPTRLAAVEIDDIADLEAQLDAAFGPSDASQTATLNVAAASEPAVATYEVNRGDSLWSIARRHNTTVDTLKSLNSLSDSRIIAGQTIAVPVATERADES